MFTYDRFLVFISLTDTIADVNTILTLRFTVSI